MSQVEEIKQRLDITEFIGQFVALKKSGRNFKGLCPFHQEKTPSFFVFPDRQSWHCFGACNSGGDIFTFLMRKEGVDFPEALNLLAERAGVVLERRPREDRDSREKIYQANLAACQFFREQLQNSPEAVPARRYLEKREIAAEMAERFQLGYSPGGRETLKKHLLALGFDEAGLLSAGLIIADDDGRSHDRFHRRLMFPILDIKKNITGFGGRVLDDSQPKYLNTPQSPVFDKSSNLYAINLAAETIRKEDRAVMMEGYMDVIAAHSFGYHNTIAAMGTAVTEAQIDRLKKLSRNLVLALDSDNAGLEAMTRYVIYDKGNPEESDVKAANAYIDIENRLYSEVRVVTLSGSKDPDEQIRKDPEGWRELVDGAMPVTDYFFAAAARGLDMSTADGKSQAVNRLGPLINEIDDDIRRDHYLSKLVEITGSGRRSVEARLAKMKSAGGGRPRPALPQAAPAGPQITRRLEEEFLSLLLSHYELKDALADFTADYFEDVRNREIYLAYMAAAGPDELRDKLDGVLRDHMEHLLSRDVRDSELEKRLAGYVLRLREDYLKGVAEKRAQVLDSRGLSLEELAKLQQPDVAIGEQLGEVFSKKRTGS